MARNETWDKLTQEQENNLQAMNDRIIDYFIAENKKFYDKHPRFRVALDFTLIVHDRSLLMDDETIKRLGGTIPEE